MDYRCEDMNKKIKVRTKQAAENYISITQKKIIFYGLMWTGIINFLILSIQSSGETINNLLFCQQNQTFLDYFECIVFGRHPYEVNGSYPPLAYLIFGFFGRFVPQEIRTEGFFYVRDSQMGMFSLAIFMTICLFLIYSFTNAYFIGNNVEKFVFGMTFLFSLPMLFLMERANIVLLVMPLTGFFLFNYDSEVLYKRHFAYICLSIAAGIKIYPALLGLLIIRRRNFKEILSCLIYGILIFFLPFLFFDGLAGLLGFWNNLIYSLKVIGGELGYGYKVNIANTLAWIGCILDKKELMLHIANIMSIGVGLVGIVAIIFGKYEQEWKLWTIPLLMMILIPGFSFIYSLIFLIIPLLDFLNQKQQKRDNIYAILFVLVFVPFVVWKKSFFSSLANDYYLLNISTMIESLAILVLYFAIIIEGLFSKRVTAKK